MEVKINKEICNYTESIIFGLPLRQFFFSALACGVAVGLYFLLRPRFGTETLSCAINQITETAIIHPVIDRLLSLPDKQV